MVIVLPWVQDLKMNGPAPTGAWPKPSLPSLSMAVGDPMKLRFTNDRGYWASLTLRVIFRVSGSFPGISIDAMFLVDVACVATLAGAALRSTLYLTAAASSGVPSVN